MGKASRTKVDTSRREKIAAQRAAERRAEQRRRILIASGSILAVIAIVVAFIVIKANSKPSTSASSAPNGPTGAALTSVTNNVTSVPASTLDKVGDGNGAFTGKIQTITPAGTPLTASGKPEMLYMGAEYCPYCAAERWAMIVALSRFGTFSGLATVHSASVNGAGNAEPYPNTPTWTFANAKYTSQYLTFTPVEMQTNIPDKSTGTYTNLQNADQGPAGAADQVRRRAVRRFQRRRIDPVHRLRQQVREHRGQLQHPGARRALLEHDRRRPAQPEQPGGPGRGRHGQPHHRRDLQDDRQPARQRLHDRRPVPGKQSVNPELTLRMRAEYSRGTIWPQVPVELCSQRPRAPHQP